MDIISISSIFDKALLPYSRLTDAELKQSGSGLFIAESIKVIASALDAGYSPVSLLSEERHLEKMERELPLPEGVPVYTAAPEVIESLTGYRLHRGVLAVFERRAVPDLDVLLADASRIAVLDGVTDPTNVGAIFRSAAALGMDAVLLKSSCDPLHRRALRVSMGSALRIPWGFLPATERPYTELLSEHGFSTAALALSEGAEPITSPELKKAQKLALIFGSEGDGLNKGIISTADHVVMLPMRNSVDSLNVASAAAVAFWVLAKL